MALGALICKGAWLGVRLRNISAGHCELAVDILGLSTDLGCRVGVALAENSWGANGIYHSRNLQHRPSRAREYSLQASHWDAHRRLEH